MLNLVLENTVFGGLDTSYRTIQNKIRFTPVESLARSTKKANIEAMKHYILQKKQEIKKTLISKKLNEFILRDYPELDPNKKNYVNEIDFSKLPIEVILDYQKELTNYENFCLLDYAEKTFSGYIKSIEKTNKYLYLEHKKTGDNSLLKIVTRYSNDYRKKIIKRMNWLMWNFGNENCCLLTLTIDPKKYNYNKYEMWKDIGKKYERFIEKLKIYFKRHNRPFPGYLFGIEAMYGRPENNYISRGNPHLHVCFFNCKYIAPARILEQYWGQGFVKINSTYKNEKIRYPIHYITKYITETFTINSPDNILIQSLVWLFNKHSFDHSAGLILPLYPKGSGDWLLNGVVSISSDYAQVDEMLVIQEFMRSLYGGFKTPPPVMNKSCLSGGGDN